MKATADYFKIIFNMSTTGEAFPADAPKTFTYNGDGTLRTATVEHDGDSFVQTFTYEAGKLVGDSGWVRQA